MKTAYDVMLHILYDMTEIGNCYGLISCKQCEYNVRCMMLSISARDVLGGAY